MSNTKGHTVTEAAHRQENDRADSTATGGSLIEAALDYARRGWPVFPVNAVDKVPHTSAKFSNGRRWGQTTDPDTIRRYWNRWPAAAIGIATGKDSGVWVIEADTLEGHDVDGLASMRALEAEHGPLPDTLISESPSGAYTAISGTPAPTSRSGRGRRCSRPAST